MQRRKSGIQYPKVCSCILSDEYLSISVSPQCCALQCTSLNMTTCNKFSFTGKKVVEMPLKPSFGFRPLDLWCMPFFHVVTTNACIITDVRGCRPFCVQLLSACTPEHLGVVSCVFSTASRRWTCLPNNICSVSKHMSPIIISIVFWGTCPYNLFLVL